MFTSHNMPDPLAMHRERKMHSKTYTKSPRVWKVCCCFLSVLRRQRRAPATAAAPAFSSLLAFITCSALTS